MATPETKSKELDPKLAEQEALKEIGADYEQKFGFHDPETDYIYKAPKGLSREVVESISEYKDEPEWMREFRLKALEHFLDRPRPSATSWPASARSTSPRSSTTRSARTWRSRAWSSSTWTPACASTRTSCV